jgi:hypothetical protein
LFQFGLISYIWGKNWKNWTNSLIAQQPQNTPENELDSVIAHGMVYIALGFCEVTTEIGAEKAAEGDRQYSY